MVEMLYNSLSIKKTISNKAHVYSKL